MNRSELQRRREGRKRPSCELQCSADGAASHRFGVSHAISRSGACSVCFNAVRQCVRRSHRLPALPLARPSTHPPSCEPSIHSGNRIKTADRPLCRKMGKAKLGRPQRASGRPVGTSCCTAAPTQPIQCDQLTPQGPLWRLPNRCRCIVSRQRVR